jgi:DHA3 family macrolide efflux protein-like MFS transporter
MLLGGILIATWGGLKNKVVMIVASSVVFGVLTLALGLSTNVWVFFGFMFLVGLAVPFFSTPSTTLLQERVEVEFQGRVFGFVGVVMATAMPIGMVLFGPLADVVPVEWVLIGAGLATFVVVAIAVLVPSGRQALAGGAEVPATPGDPTEPAAEASEPVETS